MKSPEYSDYAPYKALAGISYIQAKIKLLKEFGIHLTEEQTNHMIDLDTQVKVDNYAITLMRNYL